MQAWEQENIWLLPTSGLLQQKFLSRQRLPHCFFASASVISIAGASCTLTRDCSSVVGSEHEAALVAHCLSSSLAIAEPTKHIKKMTRVIEIECKSVLLSTRNKDIMVNHLADKHK
jgi:hypothetical protein